MRRMAAFSLSRSVNLVAGRLVSSSRWFLLSMMIAITIFSFIHFVDASRLSQEKAINQNTPSSFLTPNNVSADLQNSKGCGGTCSASELCVMTSDFKDSGIESQDGVSTSGDGSECVSFLRLKTEFKKLVKKLLGTVSITNMKSKMHGEKFKKIGCILHIHCPTSKSIVEEHAKIGLLKKYINYVCSKSADSEVESCRLSGPYTA